MNRFLPLIRGIDGIDRVYIGQRIWDEMEFVSRGSTYWIMNYGLSATDYFHICEEFKKVNSQTNASPNSMPFKVGDEIICKKSAHTSFAVGKKYIVGGIYNYSGNLGVLKDEKGVENGISYPSIYYEFVLAPQVTSNYTGTIQYKTSYGVFDPAVFYGIDLAKIDNDPKNVHQCNFKLYTGLNEQFECCFSCGKKK